MQHRYRVTWESRLPATPVPPSPRALTGVSARGLQKIDSCKNSTLNVLKRYRRLVEIRYRFPSASRLWHFSAEIVGNTARGQEIPAIPVECTPLPLLTRSSATSCRQRREHSARCIKTCPAERTPLPSLTTSTATSSSAMCAGREATRIDLRSRVYRIM